MSALYDCIFVPQGAECAAVRRGLRGLHDIPPIVAISAGYEPADRFLRDFVVRAQANAEPLPRRPLLLGLCGSVLPGLTVGTSVAYRTLRHRDEPNALHLLGIPGLSELPHLVHVDALCVERVVSTVVDKRAIAQQFQVAAIDMESAAVVRHFPQAAVVRVVSDDLSGDVPDLTGAIDDRGHLNPVALAASFARQPRAALRLIRGSLAALGELSAIATQFVAGVS